MQTLFFAVLINSEENDFFHENIGVRPVFIYSSYIVISEGFHRRVITITGAYGAYRHW
jgi:hypothetical protein